MLKKVSWKTSLCGIVVLIGNGLITVTEPDWVSKVGHTLVSLGTAAGLWFARDNKVTSEDAGAK